MRTATVQPEHKRTLYIFIGLVAIDEAYEFKTSFNDLMTMLAEIQRLMMQCYPNIHSPTHLLMTIICSQRQHPGCK